MTPEAQARWIPPICELCSHGHPAGQQLLCKCPQLIAAHGVQLVGVMRYRADACAQAQHRLIPRHPVH
jgi:hypothetical protein